MQSPNEHQRPTKDRKPFNPFYVLLLIVGTLFAITAFAYGVMALRLGQMEAAGPTSASGARLIQFLAKHGTALLIGELVLLAILTVGAIGTDEYWSRRAKTQRHGSETPDSPDAVASPKENS